MSFIGHILMNQKKIRVMVKLINRDIVTVEIEKQLKTLNKDRDFKYPQIKELEALLSSLDTLLVKEVDLENSMLCKVDWYDGFILDYTQEQQDELLNKIGANVGDNIRVILKKE